MSFYHIKVRHRFNYFIVEGNILPFFLGGNILENKDTVKA